jgi:hypothetical protein
MEDTNMARPWHPRWPGFGSGGSLVLPLPDEAFAQLPPALSLDGIEFERKREFHVTLLDRETGTRIRSQELAGALRPSVRELFEGEDWQCQRTDARWLLREDKPGGPVHSIIELLDLPALVRFRHNVGWAQGQPLPPTPAHVTLYVAGTPIGIGLSSKEEFQRLRLRRL